jgi:RNA polymerase sigma-70 factor (ECF subfamily)
VHAAAPCAELTDWSTIVKLYDQLAVWEPTAVVQLNRAVAVAMGDSPEAGLALVDDPELATRLEGYHLYQATRADLLRRVGRREEAVVAYRLARAQTNNAAEHRFIDRRIQGLAEASAGPGSRAPSTG